MSAPLVQPSPLDLDIFREMYRTGGVTLSGIDPRLSATRIAKRLKVGRARVAGRLKAWAASGFLARYDVWLNPSVYGWQGAWLNVRVDHPRSTPDVIARLALVDGVLGGLELVGEWLGVGVVFPDDVARDRMVRLVQGLPGVREVEPPVLWNVPDPRRRLSPLDVRIVQALRENSTATLREVAKRVGVSTRTMTRRYGELLDGWSVWFVPAFDFRAIGTPVVSVGVTLAPQADADQVVRRVRARYPLTLEFRNPSDPDGPAPPLGFVVLLPSSAHLDELDRTVAAIDGVAGVEAHVMVRVLSFPEWFDQHLSRLLGTAGDRPTAAEGPTRRRRRGTRVADP